MAKESQTAALTCGKKNTLQSTSWLRWKNNGQWIPVPKVSAGSTLTTRATRVTRVTRATRATRTTQVTGATRATRTDNGQGQVVEMAIKGNAD